MMISRMRHDMLRRALFAVLMAITFADARSSLQRCPMLSDVSMIKMELFSKSEYEYTLTHEYFCGSGAPRDRLCKCGASERCNYAPSPVTEANIGVCGCCAAWVIALVVLIALGVVICIGVGIYYFFCQGKWWCDGAPRPHPYCIPKTSSAVVVPPDMPFPSNLFRDYNSANFINYEPGPAGRNNNNNGEAQETAENSGSANNNGAPRGATAGTTNTLHAASPTSSTQAQDRGGAGDEEVIPIVRHTRRGSLPVTAPLSVALPARASPSTQSPQSELFRSPHTPRDCSESHQRPPAGPHGVKEDAVLSRPESSTDTSVSRYSRPTHASLRGIATADDAREGEQEPRHTTTQMRLSQSEFGFSSGAFSHEL